MLLKKMLPLTLVIPCFIACRPKPIDIEVPQAAPSITISSLAFDEHTVFVSAGYSINSTASLNDTAAENRTESGVPRDMLIDNAIVTITESNGTPDTLHRVTNGVYASRKLNLKYGVEYTLMVRDLNKDLATTATTVFLSQPSVTSAERIIEYSATDTLTKLHLNIKNVAAGDKFFVTYSTKQQVKSNVDQAKDRAQILYNFSPKTLEFVTSADATDGLIDKTITMKVNPEDTLIVQVAHIDNSYFEYLSAYKRTGYLINQLTGEPINLPTNVTPGYGFFSLCESERVVFVGNKRIRL
ncbi:MAG: DUF4249 family protein [Sphingobacteriales bacterium]|nr:MAG: DUF4249 family protein [Sphingobacteriales bacterium]